MSRTCAHASKPRGDSEGVSAAMVAGQLTFTGKAACTADTPQTTATQQSNMQHLQQSTTQ